MSGDDARGASPSGGEADPRWSAVDRWFDELFAPPDPALDAALAASAVAGLPAIQVTAQQGSFLQLLALALGARRILEIGTLGGYSTIWLARGLSRHGRLVTLEIDPKHAAVARANLERAELASRVELRLGAALETLAALAREGGAAFDLVFIDADKPSTSAYLDWALRLSRPGALIVTDNVVRGGAVVDAASPDTNVQGVRHALERLAAEPGIQAAGLQTVGSKGYDGFVIARVPERAS